MAGTYQIDLSEISMDEFQAILENRELLPSRRIVLENMAARFSKLKSAGAVHVRALQDMLINNRRVEQCAILTGIPTEYLTVLKREIGSLLPTTTKLDAFPDVDPETIAKLAAIGIKNSKQLYEQCLTPADRRALAYRANVPLSHVEELVKLSDVVRLFGVGAGFARLLVDAGVISVGVFRACVASELNTRLKEIYATKRNPQVMASDADLEWCQQAAAILPDAIEW